MSWKMFVKNWFYALNFGTKIWIFLETYPLLKTLQIYTFLLQKVCLQVCYHLFSQDSYNLGVGVIIFIWSLV